MQACRWMALAALLLACTAEPAPPGDLRSALHFVDGVEEAAGRHRLDFGAVAVGAGARRIVVVENRSDAEARLHLPAPAPPFAVEGDVDETLPPGARRALALDFLPTEAGRFEEELPLGGGLRLRLRGEGRDAARGCEVAFEPAELRFVDTGWAEARPAVVRLRSVGAEACLLEGASLPAGTPFRVEAPPPTWLAPGASAPVSLRFDPEAEGPREAELRVRVGGREEAVPLRTTPAPACARVEEPGLHFDGVATGCHATAPLTLVNECPHPVELLLTSLEGLDEAFGVEPGPLRIEPLGSERLWLDYRPAPSGGAQEGRLHLAFDNGDALTLPVRGGAAAVREERFLAAGTPLDLLVVVDLSTEMLPFQNTLAAFASTLESWLRRPQLDLRVAVTTNSMEGQAGCGGEQGALRPVDGAGPRFVEADTPDRVAALAANLVAGACMPPDGSQPLEAMRRALLQPDPADWRREGVPLFVLFIGAVEDHSPGDFFDDYVDFLDERSGVPGEGGFAAAIASLPACANMEPATRVADLVDLVEGALVPICQIERWAEALQRLELMWESARPPHFLLSSAPMDLNGDGAWGEEDGLSLWIEGERVPASREGVELWRIVSTPGGPRLELSFEVLPRSRTEVILRSPLSCNWSGPGGDG